MLLKKLTAYKKAQQAGIFRVGSVYKNQDTVFTRYDGNFIDQSTLRAKYREILKEVGLKAYNYAVILVQISGGW